MEKKSFIQRLRSMGPAAIIASAFIGPGTITTSTISGTNFQYALLWAVVFSGIASIILMDISSRIAAYGGHSVIETTLGMSSSKAWKGFVTIFMGLAILFTGLGFMAGMIIARLLGWGKEKDNLRKGLTCFLIAFGTVLAMMGKTPTQIIIVTQALSGFFLPFIAIFFVISGNNKKMLGEHTNSALQNVLGGLACAVTLAMGMNMLWNNVIMKLIG